MESQLTLKEIAESDREQAEYYLCANCNRIARNIKLSTCGHIFCGHCLSESYCAISNRCKKCNIELKDEDIFNGAFLDVFINEHINCHCVNTSVGCTWEGKVGQYYEEHIMNCSIREVESNKEDNMNDNFRLEISVDENEGNNNNWINQCDFEICDNNKEFKPRSSNTNLTQKQLKLLQNEINGECYEYTNVIIDDDNYSTDSILKTGKISNLFDNNNKNEYSTIYLNISKASMDEPFIYMLPFFITNTDNCKYSINITNRDYKKDSIITLGLCLNKSEYHNFIDSTEQNDFFLKGETITVEYKNKENSLIISNSKRTLSFNNIIQENVLHLKCFYYPFLVSTSPKNSFELHIYNL